MRFVLLLFGGVAVILVAFVVIIRVVSSDTVPDCAQVRDPEPGAWQAGDFDARSQIVQELSSEGVLMVQVGQGYGGLSSPTKELLRLVTGEKLRHGGDPLFRWCASNTAAQTDAAGNVKPDRSRSGARIDPVVALVMAVDGWQRRGREPARHSVYEDRFTLVKS